MVIPEAAVEAAAQIIYRTSGRKRVMGFEQAREACESEARELLEAAAPHMLAEAWDAAIDAAYEERVIGDSSSDALKLANPYRPAK